MSRHPVPAGPVPGRGRLMELPPGRYDWLRLDLSRPVECEISGTAWLHFEGGVDSEQLVATPGSPARAWLPVPRRDVLHGVRLPDRPELEVAAVTLVPSPPGTFRHGEGGAHG
jgi:hypothetical protein